MCGHGLNSHAIFAPLEKGDTFVTLTGVRLVLMETAVNNW